MKKTVFAVIAAMFLLAGCRDTTGVDDTTPLSAEYNAQNKYLLSELVSFQEADGFFCGTNLLDNYIQYYDKASGVSGVLCADPACAHDSSECAAYIEAGATLSYYDGSLYWIGADSDSTDKCLWKSDLSGMNREKIIQIGFEELIYPYQPQRYVIHQGKLYILGHASVVDGVQSGYRVSLLSKPLRGNENFTTVYDEVFTSHATETYRFVGGYVYLSLVTFSDSGLFDLTVTKFNVQRGTSEVIYQEADMTESPGAIWVTEEHEIYLPVMAQTEAYLWKLENNTKKVITSWSAEKMSTPKVMDGIAMVLSLEGSDRWVDIRNLSGETIYCGKLYPSAIPGLNEDPNTYSTAFLGGDKDKLIVQLMERDGSNNYTVLLDLNDGMNATLLWSSEG